MSGEGLADLALREARKVEKDDGLRVIGGMIIETCEDPNETLDLEITAFEMEYEHKGLSPEQFPEEAYEDYRAIEDSYDLCEKPNKANILRMNELRETMQTYAEANR